jgi:glycosyltransferase involved in cell wall biosynthesis
MRVLLLHNRYRAEGGEERAVADIASLLERHGHEVSLLQRSSGDAPRGRAARALLAGGIDPAEVAEAVRRTRAEVVHAHNLHPLFGWRALAAAREAGARTVLQLHNFRLFCAIGVAYRDGGPCHSCHGRWTAPGLVHRCRGSLGESVVYAAGLARQQPRLLSCADALVVLSNGHGEQLRSLGLSDRALTTLPNFVPDGGWAATSRAGEGTYALVSGRLVEEKGFDTAILACALAEVPLVIAGAGPDEVRLRALAASHPGDVRFAGWLSGEALAAVRADAGVVLAPSRSEEACPYSVLDALAAGVPALVSDLGGMPEMVPAASALPVADVDAWASALSALWSDTAARQMLGDASLALARERHSEVAYLERLLRVYGAGGATTALTATADAD